MSLVEDILDVLRIVMEYFGVPPEMVNAQTHFYYTYTSITDSQSGSQGLNQFFFHGAKRNHQCCYFSAELIRFQPRFIHLFIHLLSSRL